MQRRARLAVLVLAVGMCLFGGGLVAEAAIFLVQCGSETPPPSAYPTINAALNRAASGDQINVTGICAENIFINERFYNLTLVGNPGDPTVRATIVGQPTPAKDAAVMVRGARNIIIRGFQVQGTDVAAINVYRGAVATLDNNLIEVLAGADLIGVYISQLAHARVVNNVIRTQYVGILVTDGASARIGLFNPDDGRYQANMIEANPDTGILVTRSSQARIVGNILRNNGNGIGVARGSQADVGSNEISANHNHGVFVKENSGVNLGADPADWDQMPNTTIAPNGGYGLSCTLGGYVSGRLGTLMGLAGAMGLTDPPSGKVLRGTPFRTSCVDNLIED